MNYKKFVADGLRSMLGALGDPERDKAASVYHEDIDLTDEQLRALFSTNWIARKICTIPVQDATRKWRTWEGKSALQMAAMERRLDIRRKTFEAAWKGRLFGAGAMFIGVEGNQPLDEPLDINAVGLNGVTM